MRIHLDTDLGGDPDDACALAMLLGRPGVELVGITTTIDPGGRRAGCVAHCLELAGRDDIPVAAGAGVSLTTLRRADPSTGDERYWPSTLAARPSSPGAALDLLDHSIQQGATIVGIGPYTNLALLEVARPGSLGRAPVVVMGGWIRPPSDGLPAWGPEMDFNVHWDTRAAEVLTATAAKLPCVAAGRALPRRCGGLPRRLRLASWVAPIDPKPVRIRSLTRQRRTRAARRDHPSGKAPPPARHSATHAAKDRNGRGKGRPLTRQRTGRRR